MNNIDNSILINRAVVIGEILQQLTAVQLGPTDVFSEHPRDLRLAYEEGLCLSVVQIQDLTADKVRRYLRMLSLESGGEDYEFDEVPGDEDWVGELSNLPVDAYLFIGPPQTTLFCERALSPARAGFALAYEIGGYLSDLLSYRCLWPSPRSIQCASVWDAFDPTLAQHQLWFDLRALPRMMLPQASDWPASALDLAVHYATPNEILARELLAPWAEVAAIFTGGNRDRRGLVSLLMGRYGLPAAVAARYCNDLQTLLRSSGGERPVQCNEACLPSQMQSIHWGEDPPDDELDALQGL